DIHGLAMLVHARDHLIEIRLALLWIFERCDFVAIAELDRAFESHAAEFTRRPSDREEGRLEATARHRLRAEAVALAQDNLEARHRDIRADYEHARRVPHQRGLFDLR